MKESTLSANPVEQLNPGSEAFFKHFLSEKTLSQMHKRQASKSPIALRKSNTIKIPPVSTFTTKLRDAKTTRTIRLEFHFPYHSSTLWSSKQ
jgi:hypothetical protein